MTTILLHVFRPWVARPLLGLVLLAPSPAHAPGFVVVTSAGVDVSDSKCSLREAIIAANTYTAYGGCGAGSGANTASFSVAGTILSARPGRQSPTLPVWTSTPPARKSFWTAMT